MTTYLIIDGNKVEVPDDNLSLEEGMAFFIEENGLRKRCRVESVITIIHKIGPNCDPPYREVRIVFI